MHQVYVDLILSVLLEQYATEKNFLEDYLVIDEAQWEGW